MCDLDGAINSWHEFPIQVIRLGFFISFPGIFMIYRSTVFVFATNNYFWSKQVCPWLPKASAPNKLNWSLVDVCERNSHLLQDQQELSLYLQLEIQPRPGSQRPDMAAVWNQNLTWTCWCTWEFVCWALNLHGHVHLCRFYTSHLSRIIRGGGASVVAPA